ncbi:MAG TPA: alpha/beta hydrolase, partial [Pararhizobium sp.]|nr:alpha/beta hydrolase [Pararhizobium sp.]
KGAWRMTHDPKADDTPTSEMAALMARLASQDAALPDLMTLDAAAARAQAEDTNARWNRDLPPMEEARNITLPATPELGSPALKARLLRPAKARGLILYLHGGGWATCNVKTHERTMRVLAAESRMAVLGVDYRLAPEFPFPAALHDCVAAWRAACGMAGDLSAGGPMAVAGDSAGANLALTLMLFESAARRRLPDFGLLFYGVYGDDPTTPSKRAYGDGRFGLSSAKMKRYWEWYVPQDEEHHNPLAAPLKAEDEALRALPPLYLNAAGLDPLLSDTLALARRLDALGRSDTLFVHRGVVHGFMQMTIALAEARAAHERAAEFCRSVSFANSQGG